MASLGTASLTLTADSQKLDNKLGKAEKDVKGWGSRVGGLLSKGIGAVAKGGMMGVGMAAGQAGLDSLSAPFEKLHDIAKQGDIASSLGLTTEAFTGIAGVAKAAGSDTRDFLEGLTTLSGRAMEAASGAGEESQKLFQGLGLDAEKFAALNPEEQFYQLFEALNKVQNPAQRVSMLFKAVGEDTGKNMVSLLGKSTEELKKQAGAFSISTQSMAEAQVASQQLKESQALLDKAGTDLTISLTPLVQMLAEHLPGAIQWTREQFAGFAPPVTSAMRSVVQAVGFVVDVWDGAGNSIELFVAAIATGLGALMQDVSRVISWADGIGKAMNLDLGLGEAAKQVKQLGEITQQVGVQSMLAANAKLGEFGKQQAAALAWFDGIMAKREDRVQEAVKKLQPGGAIPNEIKTSVKVEVLKGVEAAVAGSAKWQESIARSYMMNRFGEQNKQLQAQNKANVILEQIRGALSQPMIRFGVI